jgi:RNA polymerase sigma-70 factor (sigma-E family)
MQQVSQAVCGSRRDDVTGGTVLVGPDLSPDPDRDLSANDRSPLTQRFDVFVRQFGMRVGAATTRGRECNGELRMTKPPEERLPADFADFVFAQTRALLRLGLALTGNPHDAWDLLQEALARTGERWGRAQIDEPAAYVRTVMVRLNIDRLRRLRRELPLLSPPDYSAPPDVAVGIDPWLMDALAKLTPRQRTALALRYVDDLDVRTIAARMGCSEGTVKSQLSRGTARLRACAGVRASQPAEDEKGREDGEAARR